MKATEKIINSTILSVEGLAVGSTEVIIVTSNGTYKMYHQQDCRETVSIDDILGELKPGSVVLNFIEKTNVDKPKKYSHQDSFTWTFYTIVTNKGYCDIKWYGTSDGYYSERVDFDFC